MTELDVRIFGITLGCIWGFCVLVLGIISNRTGRCSEIIHLFSKVYIGFQTTLLGCFIGALWGFLDGALSGFVISWIYNQFV